MRRLLVALLCLTSCGPRTGSGLEPVAAQTAVVGAELQIPLATTTPTEDAEFTYSSDIDDLTTRRLRPSLVPYAGGVAVFRWTPLATDVGDHTLKFSVSLSGLTSTLTVAVTVIPGSDPILFREPVGEGTTLDLSRDTCVSVAILVDDAGAAQVTLAQGDQWVDNATLDQDGPFSGTLQFCPSDLQAQTATIYPLTMVATDDGNARAEKRYTLVLGALVPPEPSPTPEPCDMDAPVITHSPHKNITTSGNLHLSAVVADPQGVASATVYWSTTMPAVPIDPLADPTMMTELPMLFVGGTPEMSSFAATIPNPVVADPPGTTATIYYFIRAKDTGDLVAGCDANVTDSPDTGVYSFVVKRANTP